MLSGKTRVRAASDHVCSTDRAAHLIPDLATPVCHCGVWWWWFAGGCRLLGETTAYAKEMANFSFFQGLTWADPVVSGTGCP